MISVWGVDHGEAVVKSAMVHVPGEKPAALAGRIVRHAGKRTGFGRTGPRKERKTFREATANPVADSRGIAEGRYSWKRAGRNVAIGTGVGGAVGVKQAQYNSTHKKKIKSTPGSVAAYGSLGAYPAAMTGHFAAGATTGGIAAAGLGGGYVAGRKLGEKYYARKKKG